MMDTQWYLRTQDETFGPETEAKLVEWARLGRIQPGQEVSDDNVLWRRVEDVPFLDMRFSIDIGDGNPRGPFNRAAAEALLASGRLPPTASLVETREPFAAEVPVVKEGSAPDIEPVAEKIEMTPAEKVVEKVVEVPVEKIVEKEVIKEIRVEVPVEKIVVDETRVKELEGLLEEERRHTEALQKRLDAAAHNASEATKTANERENGLRDEIREMTERTEKAESALKDSVDREKKYEEQVRHLEDELRRLPQAASEVADIQVAVYSIMKNEAEELGRQFELEKREFEDYRKRYQDRSDRLLERRREMIRRSGVNIEDMTRKALIERPEDPRTTQLRKELGELRRIHDEAMLDNRAKVRELEERLRQGKAEHSRLTESMKDIAQLQTEIETLRAQLQTREQELVAERQSSEELRQQQATSQQTLMARLATLESPSIGTVGTMSTNQSREARQVKLPSWMHLKR